MENETYWCDGCESPQNGPHGCMVCQTDCMSECRCEEDPPDAQAHAEWKADEELRELKEEGPRLDEYDCEEERR